MMSRKRDTNWSKDEITVLLDSIMEITRMRAKDGKRTNSREVFEYAAKKMGEKGHSSRAEREKCRTKWKKMKEEFTHAKRARDGDSRFREAPGIQPFYARMEEFINGNFDNISPHSTIVRRTPSLINTNLAIDRHQRPSGGMRASARIAASSNGSAPSDINIDTNSTNATRTTTSSINEYHPNALQTQSNESNSLPRQNLSRQSSLSNNNNNNVIQSPSPTKTSTLPSGNNQQQATPISNHSGAELCTLYATNFSANLSNTGASMLTGSPINDHHPAGNQTTEHADISYRVSTGCRQITIFGDHDVDIKFRGDCVTINKIDVIDCSKVSE